MEQDPYFVQRPDVVGILGLSSLQKYIEAIRMLAYGISADLLDEYCRLGENTTLELLLRFVRAMCTCFETHYLRQPSRANLDAQVAINYVWDFQGCLADLIACIGIGQNIPPLGKHNTKTKTGTRVLF